MATQVPPAEPAKTDTATATAAAPPPASAPATTAPATTAASAKAEAATASAEAGPEVTPEEEEEAEILSVSAENLARIKKDPELYALYRGMAKSYTQKTESLAQDRVILDAIREDPVQAARMIAQAAGLEIKEAVEEGGKNAATAVSDEITSNLVKIFGPEVTKELKPVLDKIVETAVQRAAQPFAESFETLQNDTILARSESEVETFKARHPGEITKAVEVKMVELSKKLPAGEDTNPEEYMELLYRLVKPETDKSKATKEVVERMAKAAAAAEPAPGGSLPGGKVEGAPSFAGMNLDQALDAAFEHSRKTSRLTS